MTRAPHSAVAIDAALERGDAALIAYLPVGFPSVEDSIRAGKVLADVGVDAIELGFPMIVESEGLDPTGLEEVKRCIEFLKEEDAK